MIIINCDLDREATNGARIIAKLLPEATIVDAVDGEPIPLDADAVIVTGSRASITDPLPWIPKVKAAIRDYHEKGRPLLGICFGMQLLADVLDGMVRIGATHEHGFFPLTLPRHPLFAGLPNPCMVYQFHHDRVDGVTGTVLARNEHGIQAFENGASVGVQFHPEVDVATARSMAERDGKTLPLDVPDAYDAPQCILRNFSVRPA